eukprot:11205250-Lingulodinium_polyedra.AAC.1
MASGSSQRMSVSGLTRGPALVCVVWFAKVAAQVASENCRGRAVFPCYPRCSLSARSLGRRR